MTNLKKILLSTFAFFLFINLVQAQCPANLGFELGDLSGWQVSISAPSCTGNPGGVPTGTPAACSLLRTCSTVSFPNNQIFPNSRVVVCNSTTPLFSSRNNLHFLVLIHFQHYR
jgi:hypothetical protein